MIPALLIALYAPAHADEGMWLPDQLPALQEDLTAYGVKRSAADLSRLDASPLGAIVDLDNCSGAFVSKDGLVATAYHCVGPALEYASHQGENLFVDGFHAATRNDERWAGPGVKLKVTTRIEDVTLAVFNGTRKLDGDARAAKLAANKAALLRKCQTADEVHCEIASFDSGASYRLIEQTEFGDVRVVYAPPQDVGYFGGDVDNWQWPRHSGDFAFLRVYGAQNQRPARHTASNVPYEHPHWLPAAKAAPAPGQFLMVAGYPARTFRWRSGAELAFADAAQYPTEIETGRAILAAFETAAKEDPTVTDLVGPRRLAVQNRTQYLAGNLEMFRRVEAVQRKWDLEKDLASWILAEDQRQVRWNGVIDATRILTANEVTTFKRDQLARDLRRQVKLLDAALRLTQLAEESQKKDGDRSAGFQNRDRSAFAERMESAGAGTNAVVERTLLALLLKQALTLPPDQRIPELDAWFEKNAPKGEFNKRVNDLAARVVAGGSELEDPDRRKALMDSTPWFLEKSDNPWFELSRALLPFYKRIEQQAALREAAWADVRPRYLECLRAFLPEARPRVTTAGAVRPGLFYPDANQTLRVTIGKVDGYFPRDALIAAPQSQLSGITEKVAATTHNAPPALLAAIKRGEYGPYADPKLGSVSVNYLSSADTTLGSSGSATIDAEGRFVGVLFDGNFESMATDWIFDEALIRSIHTDVAYILWYLDAVAQADALLNELGHSPAIPPAPEAVGATPSAPRPAGG